MNDVVKLPTFLAACLAFFGLLPNQTKIDFGREVIKLSNEDRQEIFEGFKKLGIECEPPLVKA